MLIAMPFPTTSDHNSRHIELGPDNKLYVSFGSPANLDYCGAYGNISACSIVRMNLDGSQVENYAVGQSSSTWKSLKEIPLSRGKISCSMAFPAIDGALKLASCVLRN